MHRLLRFAAVGLLSTGIHVAVAASFIHWVSPVAALANVTAFVVATLASFVLNSRWTFATRLHGKVLARFITVSLLGCAMAAGLSGLAEWSGCSYQFGIGLVVVFVPPVTYLLHSRWTYRQRA